jgi:hypothetical protein
VRLLASICNQKAEPVKLPGVFLFEIDTERREVTPVPLEDHRLTACVGVTGLTRYGDDLLAVVQSLVEPTTLVQLTPRYQIKNVWPLALAKDAHSITVAGRKIYLASTGTDAVVEFDPAAGEQVFWRDNDFGDDTIHLNSVLWCHGCLYATAFGKKKGETWATADAGYLLNLTAGRVVVEPIAHPHSITTLFSSRRDGLYFCESTRQAVCREDGQRLQTGSGFTRGLVVTSAHVYVGISKHRGSLTDPCGVRIYERNGALPDSRLVGTVSLSDYGQEIYDLLPL